MKATFEFKTTKELISLLNYKSMKQLVDCSHNGWKPGLDVIDDLLRDLSLNIEFKQDISPAVQGLFFDIGLVCSDIPEHWFNPQPINHGAFNGPDPLDNDTPIQIGINLSGLLSFSSAIERGAAIAVLVMYLNEKVKRPVIIKQYYSLETNDDLFEGSVVLKQQEEELNEKTLSFWLCCPDVVNCWSRIIEDTVCLRRMSTVETNNILNPNLQFGKEESSIFVSFNPENKEWTRQDSKKWISSILRSFGVNVPNAV